MATRRLDRLLARRLDADVSDAKLLNEAYRTLTQSESVRYVVGAMQPIDPVYTKNTFAQGDRVCKQLQARLSTRCDYEYQGSVTNDTHIKARSDIDILVITGKFHMLEHPQQPINPYAGNPIQDLLELRADTTRCLSAAFPEATVDATGSKAISIEGGSLRRRVDVVPSNWFNSNKYAETNQKIHRGVQILDAEKGVAVRNTPFLHNACIDYRDRQTGGGLRKAARLMKSLKYDSDGVDLSSYDIVSIAYSISDEALSVPRGAELTLLGSCLTYCMALQSDAALRASISVPDGHRKVFAEGHATAKGLDQLTVELQRLAADVLTENQRSFKRLAEARVEY